MGKALPYTLILVVLLVGVVFAVRAASHAIHNRRQARLYRDTPWQSYRRCDPHTGCWEIGVRRVTSDGEVIDHAAMVTLPETVTFVELVEAETPAIQRAEYLNQQQKR